MPLFETVLYAGVLPGVIALATLYFSQGTPGKNQANAIGSIGITLAFAVGYVLLMGFPQFPATEVTQWIFWLVVITGITSVCIACFSLKYIWKLLTLAAQSFLMAVLVMDPFDVSLRDTGHQWVWVFSVGFLGICLIHTIEGQLTIVHFRKNLFLLAAIVFFSVPTFINSRSLKLLQIAILLLALVGATWFVSLFSQTVHFKEGIISFVVTIMVPLMVAGNRYASLPELSVAFLIAAWFAPWLIQWHGEKPRPWLEFIIRLFIVIVLSVLAFYQTIDFDTSAASSSEYGY